MSKIDLVCFGSKFYSKSRTMIGILYSTPDWERYDWGMVSSQVEDGNTITIRPPTAKELAFIEDVTEKETNRWNELMSKETGK